MQKRVILLVVLLAGCIQQVPEPAVEEQTSPSLPVESAPSSAEPDSVGTAPRMQPQSVGMDSCLELLLQVPASDAEPRDEWFPEGSASTRLVPGTYSYLVAATNCGSILIDNATVELDRHVLWIFTSMEFGGGHPNGTGLDYLLVGAWTDSPALGTILATAGFPIAMANFTALHHDAARYVMTSGSARLELKAVGNATEGSGAVATSPRLHAVSKDGQHVFADLRRQAAPGFHEDRSRPGMATIVGLPIEAATDSIHGTLSAHTFSIHLLLS